MSGAVWELRFPVTHSIPIATNDKNRELILP